MTTYSNNYLCNYSSSTIRGVLERNPRTLAKAKVVARDMEHIDRDYKRLWRREDELIPQLIPLLPRSRVEPIRPLNQSPYASIEAISLPLALRDPLLLVALSSPRVDPQIEEVQQRLGATQLRFHEAKMKQFQGLTDQIEIRNKQPSPPPQTELGKHLAGFWCTQCLNNMAIRVSFVGMDRTVIKE